MNNVLEKFLDDNKIEYTLFTHPAVFTVSEAEEHCKSVPGLACKNLFLKDKKVAQFFLLTMPATKRLNMKELAKALGVKEFRFGTPEELMAILGLIPGAVSPLGLINDTKKRTQFLIDKEVSGADSINVHPNINTESIELKRDAFHRLVDALKNPFNIISFP